ncbi:MAG: formylglycine-generating enzyme family protein [Planctomycetota bacterium]|nr:formylglycine-generating enzyme family protein [Planctomycetota bacterium]
MRSPYALLLLCLPFLAVPVHAEDAPPPFTGRVVYEQTATGDSDGAKAFRGMAPTRITVHFGTGAYRQDEEGGLNAGSYIARRGLRGALRLDPKRKRSTRGGLTDLEATEPKVKAFMPWHFKTGLEKTDETDTILGHAVRRYRVTRSAFVRAGAQAHIWVAEDLALPASRFQFEFESSRTISPVPLSIPLPKGTILKMEIVEAGTPVTITVTAIEPGTPDPALFEKPDGFEGPLFPIPPAVEHRTRTVKPMTPEAVAALPKTLETKSGLTLKLILPGTFEMGTPTDASPRRKDEGPVQVTLTRPYYIGIHEVTQAQWRTVMGTDSPSHFKGADRPVEKVTWAQARAFCAQLSEREGATYRLPTEAEWEYAARAGESPPPGRPHGVFKTWLNARAWQSFNAQYKTHPVGSLEANAWGLYDTLGNVSEWTASGYGPYPTAPCTDPDGIEAERKVVRGADWVSSHDFCRATSRTSQDAAKAKSTIGLRVVREP